MAPIPVSVRAPYARALIVVAILACSSWAQDALGLPEPPPLDERARMDSMVYADRAFDPPATTYGDGGNLVQVTLNGAQTGTGKSELFFYQLPNNYDELGPPHPVVLAYHGFGQSALNVSSVSTVDEEADARGYVYMAVTGIDDALFGAPIVQQNVEAAIDHVFTNLNVDEDRLFMVGFSMGAGIVTNFASRHRDPDGIMVAGVATVSGSYDWTQSYILDPLLQPWLENEFNFGDDPVTNAFEYQQASAIFLNPQTYPPLPGTLVEELSMSTNLGTFPVYMTWDTEDTLPELPLQNQELEAHLQSLGTQLETNVVTGTVDPDTQLPATHSWFVLDEVDMFDFFDGLSVDRTPSDFRALVDVPRRVSYLDVTPRVNLFGDVTATQGRLPDELTFDFTTTIDTTVDLGVAGMGSITPVHLMATADPSGGLSLRVGGADEPPSYLLDFNTGTLVTGVDANPAEDELLVGVGAGTTLDVSVVTEPWLSDLVFTPDPASIGEPVTVTIDGPPAALTAYLMFGSSESLTTIQGSFTIVVPPIVPFVALTLPLDLDGDLTAAGDVPPEPALQGSVIPVQAILFDGANDIVDISNLQLFRIE